MLFMHQRRSVKLEGTGACRSHDTMNKYDYVLASSAFNNSDMMNVDVLCIGFATFIGTTCNADVSSFIWMLWVPTQ